LLTHFALADARAAKTLLLEKIAAGTKFHGTRKEMARLVGKGDIYHKGCLEDLMNEGLIVKHGDGTYSFAV
jgi:hypothetical protein